MTPVTIEELVCLNPRFDAKPIVEVEALLQKIQECGWQWNPELQSFEHPILVRSIHVRGLDLFTAEKFAVHHNSMLAEFASNPREYFAQLSAKRTFQNYGCPVVSAFVIILLFGWTVLPWVVWGVSLITLGLLLTVLYRRARHAVLASEKDEEG